MASDSIVESIVALSEQIRWSQLEPATQTAARRELIDLLGDMMAGHALLDLSPWLAATATWSGDGDCRTIDGSRYGPAAAALINGYFTHALELDDTHDEAVLHAGAAVLPAILAACDIVAAKNGTVEGERFMEAMILGIEVSSRLGKATDLNLVDGGWIYSALLGHFGAAAAASRILSDDPDALRSALGAAYTLTSGNHQSSREGAETKHLQPAIAASNGLLAALMARDGLVGVVDPFLGVDGLARVYLHDKLDAHRFGRELGEVTEIERLSFKPYPSCRLTHPAITAALQLYQEVGDRLDARTRIALEVNPQAHDVVGKTHDARMRPDKRLDAQFSIYWCVAVALAKGAVLPGDLVAEIPPSDEVADWIDRISCKPAENAGDRDVGGCILTATGAFGERRIEVSNAKGHPDNPVSDEALKDKFRHNASLAKIEPAEHEALIDLVWTLESETDAASALWDSMVRF